MAWFGLPLMSAKPTGLFINTLSMLSATLKNFRNRRLDIRLALPILLLATLLAPVGAYIGKFLPHRMILVIFMVFLVYSGTMMLFFSPEHSGESGGRIYIGIAVGAFAGFLGGLLGVGGGALLSPVLILLGYEPKKVASTTALVVFFSSLSGFLAYWRLGTLDPKLLLWVSLPAVLGGWTGTYIMHHKISSNQMKKIIGVIMYIIALKMLLVALA